jgi:hypothetical protein
VSGEHGSKAWPRQIAEPTRRLSHFFHIRTNRRLPWTYPAAGDDRKQARTFSLRSTMRDDPGRELLILPQVIGAMKKLSR